VNNTLSIREGSVAEAVAASLSVPELGKPPLALEYEERVKGIPHVILLAQIDNEVAGFKIGYEREGYWYSWLGGVHPDFRRRGVARALADAQDEWARQKGYPHVTFKTLNRLRSMLKFAIERGFNIIRIDEKEDINDYRIWLRREL